MKTVLIICISILFLPGCATIIDGYEATIKVSNVTDSTLIQDASGKDYAIINRNNIRLRVSNINQPSAFILIDKVKPEYLSMLRSKYDSLEMVYDAEIKVRRIDDLHLNIQHKGRQIILTQYPKVGLGWFFLDLLTGGVGFVLDSYTGNWNEFDNIQLD